ncbi:hypothetical protein ARMSODRAFT_977294 [Armillaria solidipes]|uniref:Uncharacterized protein n=1 Tax=Armillaria solidipes TaxID=1076256 RepID=A0A2H3BI55_9AGAR|nr:hypothetical protein ARMSODRAFT_977294 [Armillaria solidipes]
MEEIARVGASDGGQTSPLSPTFSSTLPRSVLVISMSPTGKEGLGMIHFVISSKISIKTMSLHSTRRHNKDSDGWKQERWIEKSGGRTPCIDVKVIPGTERDGQCGCPFRLRLQWTNRMPEADATVLQAGVTCSLQLSSSSGVDVHAPSRQSSYAKECCSKIM